MDEGLLSRPPEEGARLIALSWLDQAAAAFPRLQDPADIEALHDFRVGLRRLRSCLRSLVPEIDLLATSPLTRAAQTGAILDSVYGGIDVVEIEELSPETTPEQLLRWLRQQKEDVIAAVGHEPSLSQILGWLLTGTDRRLFAFRKGGACLLEFGDAEPAGGTATLLWALTPAQLRTLAD